MARGRKRKIDIYFGPEEEEAVKQYLLLGKLVQHPEYPDDPNRLIWIGSKEEEIERERIYNNKLKEPLNKMISLIIRTYGLYRKGWSEADIHADALSHLAVKAHKFEDSKGKKAYSYYGTICKNYLLGHLIKDDKKMKQNASFEDSFSTLEERDDLQYTLKDDNYDLDNFILDIIEEINNEIESDGDNGKKPLTINEIKVGFALIEILENWEEIFHNMEGTSKFNRYEILETMREYTHLSTKDIRNAMKRYKTLYNLVKDDKIDDGLL